MSVTVKLQQTFGAAMCRLDPNKRGQKISADQLIRNAAIMRTPAVSGKAVLDSAKSFLHAYYADTTLPR